jgi:hypothetical protein
MFYFLVMYRIKSPKHKHHKDLEVIFFCIFYQNIYSRTKLKILEEKFRPLTELTGHYKIRTERQPCNNCLNEKYRETNTI